MDIKPLSVKNLTKIFQNNTSFFSKPDSFLAIDDLSFDLEQGEILGLLGPNGAGKTTIIHMLLGLLSPSRGTISYFGKDLSKNRSEILEHVTFLSPYLKLPGSLTIEENLIVYAHLYNLCAKEQKERIAYNLNFFGLWSIRNRLTKVLSAGQLTRLMLAKVFLSNPKIVLLDEPTAALDYDIALQVRKCIIEHKKLYQTSIILTSHNMAEVEELCDRVLVLKNGKQIACQTPEQLTATIKHAYLQLHVADIKKAELFAQKHALPYTIEHGVIITFEIAEASLPEVLTALMQDEITYTEISIAKPSLEDYFLSIAKSSPSTE